MPGFFFSRQGIIVFFTCKMLMWFLFAFIISISIKKQWQIKRTRDEFVETCFKSLSQTILRTSKENVLVS